MRNILTLLLAFTLSLSLSAQQQSLYKDYIKEYKGYAIDQMKRYGIPASITLAQGLLESAAGTSKLARKGRNHFGIKTGPDWKGRYMRLDDDAPKEKFRVYRSVKASYEDHSKFLYNKPRYAQLFKLSVTDYKGWARGLKKAGYATNPQYASMLIELIERYDLDQYDSKKRRKKKEEEDRFATHPVHMCNGCYYIIAQPGDTYKSLSKIAKKSERKLRKYNEVDKHYPLTPGDIVYLEEKEKKADKSLKKKYHYVSAGESMHSISQRYGMRIETLFKNNKLSPDYRIQVGDSLLIRK